MKSKFAVAVAAAALLVSGAAQASAELADKAGCNKCHAADTKKMGPSYKDIAKKYKGDGGAAGKLAAKVKAGGGGVWGTIPMPPNNVPDADIKTMVDWILAMQ